MATSSLPPIDSTALILAELYVLRMENFWLRLSSGSYFDTDDYHDGEFK